MTSSHKAILSSLVPLVRDVARYSGARGVRALVYVFLGAVVEGLGLLLLVPLLSLIMDQRSPVGTFGAVVARLFRFLSADTRLEKLALIVTAFIVLVMARAFILQARDQTVLQLSLGYMRKLRSRLTQRLVRAEWSVVSRLRHGRIVMFLGTDVRDLNRAVSLMLDDSIMFVMLASQIAIALWLSPVLASLALALVALGFVTLLPMLERARKFGDFVTRADLGFMNDIVQFLGAMKLSIGQNLQGRFAVEFDTALGRYTEEQIRYARRQSLTRIGITSVASVAAVLAVVLGVAVVGVPASILLALLVVFTRMSAPAAQLHLDLQRLVESLPAWERVRDFENELVREAASLDRASPDVPLPEGAIEFRNVSFVHKAGESAERDGGVIGLAVSVEPGSIVGVTGDSGAGKTTFADLLVGLYPPQSGRILVGGVPLAGATVSRWRDGIGYVAQDAFLFHDTIRNNLLWANPGLDEAHLWEGLEIAGIADFVRRSPDGLDTVVGERGSLISGGERQRIALARAILRAARLLVLDEATNAIDIDGERQLLERLMAIAPRPTIIIVAHRPQTLICCGRILVFKDGRIVADSRETSPQDALAKLDLEPRNVLA